MKTNESNSAILANIRLLNRRAAQRSRDSSEDSKLESSIIREMSREIEARIAEQARGGNIVTRALLNDAKASQKHPQILSMAELWYETAEYCETAAEFYDKRYGRSVEYYFRMKERAATLRDCVSAILLNPLATNLEKQGYK